MRDNGSEDSSSFGAMLSPAGAGIAAICFFLPWVKLSCLPNAVSGADMGGVFWLVLIAALAILASVFYFKGQGRAGDAKPTVIASALLGLGVIGYKLMQLMGGVDTGFGRISGQDLGLEIQIGAYGTIGGLVLALIGAAGLESRLEGEEDASDAVKCPECGEKFPASYRWDTCEKCGAQLKIREQLAKAPTALESTARTCPQCKRVIPANEAGRFCGECGSPLGS